MPSRSPGTTLPPAAVSATTGATAEIAVHGPWSHRLGLDVSATLRHRFAAGPRAIIIDLRNMVDEDAASLPLWLAARRTAAVRRPPVQLSLCLPETTTLALRLRLVGARRLPLYATMPEARTATAAQLAD